MHCFPLLFDNSAQLSYVNPKGKAFFNPEIKAKKEVVLKMFSRNRSIKILGVAELVVSSKTGEEDIRLQAFITDICFSFEKNNTKFAEKIF